MLGEIKMPEHDSHRIGGGFRRILVLPLCQQKVVTLIRINSDH
jgi:hypothetical protein